MQEFGTPPFALVVIPDDAEYVKEVDGKPRIFWDLDEAAEAVKDLWCWKQARTALVFIDQESIDDLIDRELAHKRT